LSADQYRAEFLLRAPGAAAPAGVEPTASPEVPAFYQAFTDLAGQVQQHLVAVGEPEAIGAPPTGGPVERSAQISRTFAAAARRHRREAGRPARPAAPKNQRETPERAGGAQ